MQIIADTGPRGHLVRANATTLALGLTQGATQMQLVQDVFADGDVVTVGEEDIRVDTHGTLCQVTRARSGTPAAAHASGQNVRLAVGSLLLDHTFDGVSFLSAVRAAGEVEAMFGLELDGVLRYLAPSTPYQLEMFFPQVRCQPAQDTRLRVLVWSWAAEAVFWAQMQA
ncbi:hypothetical protein LLH00_00645 [bacterium]|nr:hypothetical protein [bacterium]